MVVLHPEHAGVSGAWDGCHWWGTGDGTKRGPVHGRGDCPNWATIDGVVLRDVDVRGNRQPFRGWTTSEGPPGASTGGVRGALGPHHHLLSLVWAVEGWQGGVWVGEGSLGRLPKSA